MTGRTQRSSLLAAATLLIAGALLPAAALAGPRGNPGGTPLPDLAPASAAAPEGPVVSPDAPVFAATQAASPPQHLDALVPLPLRSNRRDGDPFARDLGALPRPSAIAAIDGHVVAVRQLGLGSQLVDLADPGTPRLLLASTRRFGAPSAGRDAAGRPVIVISPCAGDDEILHQALQPNCPLRAIDLRSGASRPLRGTTGALSGDLSGRRLVFTRLSPTAGVRLYESDGMATTAVAMPRIGRPGDGWRPIHGTPLPGGVRPGGLDVDNEGRVAIVLEYGARSPRFSSGLWLQRADGSWRLASSVTTTRTATGSRHVLAPTLTNGGVLAYLEGVVEQPSFVGGWSDEGAPTLRRSLRRTIGRSTILHAAALDGERLVFVDWMPGAPCGAPDAPICGVREAAPLALR